ncbi:hypothetical protein B0H19DRAFT_1022743 [Mycena capillaripes]|nr:hypothetical protein B0H19DRAFT_1022743 [Mycena capillaripes]
MSFAIRTDRVRIAMLTKRKPGTTKDEFSCYWREVHGPLLVGLDICKSNLLKYEQAHPNAQMLQSISQTGFQVAELDGIAILEGESHEKLMELNIPNEEFAKVVIPDAAKFLDVSELRLLPLDIITVIDKKTT